MSCPDERYSAKMNQSVTSHIFSVHLSCIICHLTWMTQANSSRPWSSLNLQIGYEHWQKLMQNRVCKPISPEASIRRCRALISIKRPECLLIIKLCLAEWHVTGRTGLSIRMKFIVWISKYEFHMEATKRAVNVQAYSSRDHYSSISLAHDVLCSKLPCHKQRPGLLAQN